MTPHILRHSLASVAADLGYSELTIAALLGHRKASMTSRYAHHADAVLLQAADAVSDRIAELMGKLRASSVGAVGPQNRDADPANAGAERPARRQTESSFCFPARYFCAAAGGSQMTNHDSLELARWTLAQTLVWIIYRTPQAVAQTPCTKDVFDVTNDLARRDGIEPTAMSADLQRRDELMDYLKRGTLRAWGLRADKPNTLRFRRPVGIRSIASILSTPKLALRLATLVGRGKARRATKMSM